MQFLTSKVISSLLFLLYLGLFLAGPTEAVIPELGDNGIVIEGAFCSILYYYSPLLYQTVRIGVKRLQTLKESQPGFEIFSRYEPAAGDILPYQPPYYRQFIQPSPRVVMSPIENDFVIFTEDGKLVDVVHQDLRTEVATYSKCRLELPED